MGSNVGVVIPYHGEKDLLPQALASIRKQTIQPDELIVVDDFSGDPPIQEANKFNANLIVHDHNKGLASARNTGINALQSRYYIALDSDDWLEGNYIERMLYYSRHSRDVYHYPDAYVVNRSRSSKWKAPEFDIYKLLRYNFVVATSFVPKVLWELASGYDPKYSKAGGWEDWAFWLTLCKHGAGGVHVPEWLFYRRVRNNSMSKRIKGQRIRKLKKMLREDFDKLYIEHGL